MKSLFFKKRLLKTIKKLLYKYMNKRKYIGKSYIKIL